MKVSALVHELEGVSDQRLAEMWCELNRWGWPKEMGRVELKNNSGNPRRREAMNEIMGKIGIKACLREWNRDTMGDDEFEAWWRVNRRAA